MKRTSASPLVALLAAAWLPLLLSCDDKKKAPPDPRAAEEQPSTTGSATPTGANVEIDESLLPAYGALPPVMESKENPITEEKIMLGRALFYETRLSASNEISCNTCHILTVDGADARTTSVGHKKQTGKRNAPTVYNAAGHFVQFWDGRAKTIEDQAKGPITNPVEMAMQDEKSVLAEIGRVKWYKEQFKKAFPEAKGDPITMDNLAKAIGAFRVPVCFLWPTEVFRASAPSTVRMWHVLQEISFEADRRVS